MLRTQLYGAYMPSLNRPWHAAVSHNFIAKIKRFFGVARQGAHANEHYAGKSQRKVSNSAKIPVVIFRTRRR